MNGWYELDGKEYWYENTIRQSFDFVNYSQISKTNTFIDSYQEGCFREIE